MAISATVVIPCFRCAGTVERAVDSVIRQTVMPAEAILVDDASGDNTLDMLERMVAKLGSSVPTRIIRLPQNRGPSAARNIGWAAAREKYVAFLDADASWHPRKLELQQRFMEVHSDVALSGHLRAVTPEPIDAYRLPEAFDVSGLSFRDLLWSNPIAPSSIMVRKDLVVRFPEALRRMEDQRFLLDLTRAGHKVALLRTRLAAHHKPDFGAAGLSADLIAMEKAELENYRALYRQRALRTPLFVALYAWSLAKFARRLAIVAVRRAVADAA